MKDAKRWLPGAIISILLIAAILYFVDLRAMVEALGSANYTLLAIALCVGFVWIAVRAQVWRTLLRDRPTYSDVLWTVGEGYVLNNFLPFRLGEIGRAFLLSRKSGNMKFGEILPTIVIERIVDLIFSTMIFLFSLPYVISRVSGATDAAAAQNSERIGYIASGVALFGLVMLYVLAHYNQWAIDLYYKLSERWSSWQNQIGIFLKLFIKEWVLILLRTLWSRLPPLQKPVGEFLESFFKGLGVLKDGWLFLRFLFWMALNWAVAIIPYYLITLAYFPEATWLWGVFGLGMAAFGGAIPSAPGGVGTFEGAVIFAITRFTPDQSTALAAALSMRLYNYITTGIIGGIGFLREGQTLSGVYQELMSFRKRQSSAEAD